MFTQLNPPIPIKTPKGEGIAIAVIDYGVDWDLMWVVFLHNGECWTFRNQEIRATKNITLGRVNV